MVHNRPLKELELNCIFQLSEFAELASAVEGSVLQRTLETLNIRLGCCIDTSLAFPILADLFPALIRFSYEQTAVEFEVGRIM